MADLAPPVKPNFRDHAAALVREAGGAVVTLDGCEVFAFDLRNYMGAKLPFLATAPRARGQLVAEVGR